MLKRLLASLLSLLLFSGVTIPSHEISHTDTDYLTVADTLVMASNLHSTLSGSNVNFRRTSRGFSAAEEYAKENGIMSSLPDESYLKHNIAKSEFIYMIFSASGSMEFEPINEVLSGQIIDVNMHRYYAEALYTFARAGIVTCENGLFNPDDCITFSDAEAVAERIQNKSLRIIQEYDTKPDYSERIVAEDSFYVSPVGYTRFTNVYVSEPYDNGYIQVDCSDNALVSSGICGWYDDNNAILYIAAKEEGVATVTLTFKSLDGEVLAEDKLKIIVDGVYKDASDAEVYVSEEVLKVACFQTKAMTVSFDLPEGECENPVFSFTVDDPEHVSAEWGDWKDASTSYIKIHGLKEGQTTVYIELFDEDTGDYLAGQSITVIVTERKPTEFDATPKVA